MANTKRTTSSRPTDQPPFPLAAFFWPLKAQSVSQWIILPVILMVTALFQWTTGIWPYSGQQSPPMHGDFEAQRHWMEITIHLPITHWYFHDLQWWGLDYPPLTAYHSWLLGQVGNFINPDWFALYLSRGLDNHDLKVFMRGTVLVSEYLIYIPAIIYCTRRLSFLQGVSNWDANVALTAILLQPATILIDNGHFQYNTVMLGFFVAALTCMLTNRPYSSCFFFVSALGFKQMALFYAPAVAAYLAGICIFPRINSARLVGMAAVTGLSFAALIIPLLVGTWFDASRGVILPTDTALPPQLDLLPFQIPAQAWYRAYLIQLAQAVHRIFPFARGLFEDKVANVWCAIHSSGIHKLSRHDSGLLSKAALGLTLLSIAPSCLLIFFKPKRELLPYAFASTAWGFFMCSYQVHEKNVLLPLLPVTLLLATKAGLQQSTRQWVGFANVVACWTMFPLLARDQLRIPYFVLTALWAWLMGLPPFSFDAILSDDLHIISKLIHASTYLAIIIWHIVEATISPPHNKPDLWVVANVCIGAAAFGFCYLWCLWRMVDESGISRSQKARRIPRTKKLQ